ncbi:MAG: polysaccharide biosynthesis/export family protein [Kiritimatiellales bacterium]|nr:polysaccharide biosynthesis/export family protein [Kiritimatiellales bacterium]
MSLLAGCLSRTASVAVAGGDDSSLIGFYQLRSMDPLEVNLLGIPEEKNIQTVIDEKGNITLPYINEPVKASGLTTSELEREIRKIYIDGQIYRNITVNVLTSAKTYYMEGEIRNPGGYVLGYRITLLQAIAAASGYTEYADKTDIIITRNGQIIKANAKYLEKHPEKDIPIEAGDRIKVDRSMF